MSSVEIFERDLQIMKTHLKRECWNMLYDLLTCFDNQLIQECNRVTIRGALMVNYFLKRI